MPQITQLKLQKNKKIVNIFIDNQFTAGLDLISVKKHGLKVGMDISRPELKKLIETSTFEKLLSFSHHFLSYRPRSEKEIYIYLNNKIKKNSNISEGSKIIKKIITKLKKQGLINDKKFAQWWINQRLKFRPKGKIILKKELYIKGIDEQIIQKVLPDKDDIQTARKAANKKLKIIKDIDTLQKKRKFINFLQRRGFTWEVIKKIVDENSPKK